MNISVTEKAQEELKRILDKKGSDGKALRIYVAGVGWGGPSFGIALDEQKENDDVTNIGQYSFLVDKELIDTYGTFNVDYTNDWLRKGFHIVPNRGGSSCS